MRRLLLLLLLVVADTSFAATRFVATDGSDNGDCLAAPCRSVGHAIQRASAGDVIAVGAGRFYFGDVVEKAVVLRGLQAGVDARSRVNAQETILSGSLLLQESAGLVLDGFTFECESCTVLVSTEGGARIVNNRFRGGIGQLYVYAGGNTSTEVRFNSFEGVARAAGQIGLPMKTDGLVILTADGDRHSDVRVDSNRFSGSSHSLVSLSRITAANELSFTNNELVPGESGRALDLSEVDGIRIAGNSISGSASAAVHIEKSRNVDLIGNTIFNNATAILMQDGEGLRIEGNTFVDNTRALAVGANAEIHANRFGENHVDIELLGSVFADAKNNWFGCNGGPAQCAVLLAGTGTIFASPWLVMSLVALPDRVAPQRPSTIVADLNHNSDGALAPGFPDGTMIHFAAASVEFGPRGGTVDPEEAATHSGQASTTFTAAPVGEWFVYAQLDEEQAEVLLRTRQPRRRAVGN